MNGMYDLSSYVDRLYSAAVRKTGDSHAAEDIAQETFLAAVSQLAGGKRPDNLWAWLLGILSNKYCDWLREKYRKPQVSFEEYSVEPAGEDTPDDDTEEKLEAIRRELGYLARGYREVMVRFYLRGQTVEKIAEELQIPAGTVKSRLNMGRKNVREGVADMNDYKNYARQSYEPDTLRITCAGEEGIHHEPFSLVQPSDRLSQSILILAYPKPLSESELARALGVPSVFVEPVVDRLTEGELMRRRPDGKVYTDFIIYTQRDRKAAFDRQLAVANEHFKLFWEEVEKGLAELRKKPFYQRQKERVRTRLELHFCVKVLLNAQILVRNEVTGAMPYSDYPYRRDGGRWLAMGMQYPAGYRIGEDAEFWTYSVSGESGFSEHNFRDAKCVELRDYGTVLGRYPDYEEMPRYVKWFYELSQGVPEWESAVDVHVLQDVESLTEAGFLARGGRLELDIPVLSRWEYRDECSLAAAYEKKVAGKVREVLLPVFDRGFVKLPGHLKSVPRWQQYMFCGDRVPMAVILRAREEKLFLEDVNDPVPAALLIHEKTEAENGFSV